MVVKERKKKKKTNRKNRPILLHTQHGNYIAEKGSGKDIRESIMFVYSFHTYIEKDLADPVQITKDVERSLYYYPQGKIMLIFFGR